VVDLEAQRYGANLVFVCKPMCSTSGELAISRSRSAGPQPAPGCLRYV